MIEVDTSLSGECVVRILDRLAITRGLPLSIVCDNGPEFISRALDAWAHHRGVALLFTRPGTRWIIATSRASTGSSGMNA